MLKCFALLPLFLLVSLPLYSLNNRFYFTGAYGLIHHSEKNHPYNTPPQTHYFGANLGWHGVFESQQSDPWDSGFGSYNLGIIGELGYYHYIPTEGDSGSLKISAGVSLGQYFVWYIKPTLFYQFTRESLGLAASVGFKIHSFINTIAIGFGIGADIPIPGVGQGMYPESSIGFYVTVDLVYDTNRIKQ